MSAFVVEAGDGDKEGDENEESGLPRIFFLHSQLSLGSMEGRD